MAGNWRKGSQDGATPIRWPSEWNRSVLIPICIHGDVRKCFNNRTITLIPHISKVMLCIITNERDTGEQILNVCQIIEKCREFNTP